MLRVHNFCVSVDGYGAGPDQDLDNPVGVGGGRLHDWIFQTRTGRRMLGTSEGADADDGAGVDDEMMAAGETGLGATIMGRNMFGPVRGSWASADAWNGWWGADPPYHHPVFVLTNHVRPSVTMQGGTVFHFVTDGIDKALERAVDAAGGLDVRLGGGVSTIRQYLRAGLVDRLHLAIIPVVLGRGERLFTDGLSDGYTCTSMVSSPAATHVVLTRR